MAVPIKKYNDFNKNKNLDKNKKPEKYVYYIVTQEGIDRYKQQNPGKEYDIRHVGYRILCITEEKLKKFQTQYKVGDVYKREIIILTKSKRYSDIVDKIY